MANMRPFDVPSMKFATAFFTIGDRRYAMLHAKNFEANVSIDTPTFGVLGRMFKAAKPNGAELKCKITVYKVSEMFDKVIEEYKNTGIMPTFEVQVSNDDPATNIGRSEKVYHDCVITGDVLLSAFDVDGEFIEQEIEFYAMDYSSNGKYTDPDYM